MVSHVNLKEAFEVESKHGAFFTGGQVLWTNDGLQLLCHCGGHVTVLDIAQGSVTAALNKAAEDEETDTVTTFTLNTNGETIVTSHKSGLMKLWNWKEGTVVKQWKSIHKGPVAQLAFEGNLLASGGSDSNIRLWDLQVHTCTHSLKGISGVVSVLKFRPESGNNEREVFAAADDTTLRSWSVVTGQQRVQLTGHFSKVTGIVFSWDNRHLISCGRDRVLIMWDLDQGSAVRTLATYETLEAVVLLPEIFKLPNTASITGGTYVASAGENGVVRVWDMQSGKELYSQHNSVVAKATETGSLAITQLLFNSETNSFAVVTVDHNVIFHQLETFHCTKQLIGFSDEILDVVLLGAGDSHVAVATNSTDIKLYDVATMGCQLLRGHTDMVLALANATTNPYLMLSSSKDNTVRLWLLDAESESVVTLGVGARHTSSVGSIAFGHMSHSFFVSVSQDTCLKLWTFNPKSTPEENVELNVKLTAIAHSKDINSVCIAPNDKLIATGSQDKTAKLWSVDDLSLLGTLRGHRRGIWCVRFSPVDQVLLSTSADCTMKFWSLADLSCLKTLEGHDCFVLRGDFISKGLQVISAGADGILKLWTIKTSECVGTFEHHDDRVWGLTVSRDESFLITGGSNSELVKWRDVTEQQRLEKQKKKEDLTLQEQDLANLVHSNQLLAALKLALALERPLQVLHIVKQVLSRGNESGLRDTITSLQTDQKELLLKCANTWNTNSKNCHAAQLVLSILIDDFAVGTLPMTPSAIEDSLPYTERHFLRLTKLLQDSHILKYTEICMQPHAK